MLIKIVCGIQNVIAINVLNCIDDCLAVRAWILLICLNLPSYTQVLSQDIMKKNLWSWPDRESIEKRQFEPITTIDVVVFCWNGIKVDVRMDSRITCIMYIRCYNIPFFWSSKCSWCFSLSSCDTKKNADMSLVCVCVCVCCDDERFCVIGKHTFIQ